MALLLLLCICPTPRVAHAAQTTIQPGPTDGIDTFVWADNPTLNRGSITYMYVRTLSYAETWGCAVALIKFDLSSLVGVTITSATLYFYESSAGWWDRGTVYAYRILGANSDWSEGGATWNHKVSSSHWAGDSGGDHGTDAGCTQSGVDWDATPLGSVDCGNLDLPLGYEFSMTWNLGEFQEMISNNYGFVLYSTSPLGPEPFSSDEATYTSWRPKLVVVYAEIDTYASDYSTLKDSYTIGETVYAKAIDLPSVAAWLSGWDNRVKMTIDKNDITSSLSNFPVLIHLSASSGRGPDDVSFVFDEIQGNSKKIAVTRGDGVTECYVEIERWDYASEQAWLWVKVSSVSSTADTDLYLYYDKDHADNANVGNVGESSARQVWTNNFRGVWHLSESSGNAQDSTSYATSGTYSGSPYTQGVSGKIASASDFGPTSPSSGQISCGDPADGHLDFGTNSFTAEFWVYFDGTVSDFQIPLYKGGSWSGDPGYDFEMSEYSPYDTGFNLADGSIVVCAPYFTPTFDTWMYLVGVCDRSAVMARLFKNGVEVGTGLSLGSLGSVSTTQALRFPHGGYMKDLILDEVRISYGRRSDAWIKASYESGRDHLIDFGSVYDIKYYSNWDGSPVERGTQSNMGESPLGEWRSLYTIKGSDPAGSWGVRVYEAGTSTLIASCSFTVVPGVQEFPYGAMVALVTVYAIYLAKKKTLQSLGRPL